MIQIESALDIRRMKATVHNTTHDMKHCSLPSERDNRLSAFNPEMRSKTDNLERMITEVIWVVKQTIKEAVHSERGETERKGLCKLANFLDLH